MVFCCIALVGIAIIYFCLLWLRQLFTWPKRDKNVSTLPGPPRVLAGQRAWPVYGHTALFMDKAGDIVHLFDPLQRQVCWLGSLFGLNRRLGDCFAVFIWGQWRVAVKGPENARRLMESQKLEDSWPWTPPVTLLGRSCFGLLEDEEREALRKLIGRCLSHKHVQLYAPVFAELAEKCLDEITTGQFKRGFEQKRKRLRRKIVKQQKEIARQSQRRRKGYGSSNRGRSASPTPTRRPRRGGRRNNSSRARSASPVPIHNRYYDSDDSGDVEMGIMDPRHHPSDYEVDDDEHTLSKGPILYKVKWAALRSYTLDLIDGPILNLDQWLKKRDDVDNNNPSSASAPSTPDASPQRMRKPDPIVIPPKKKRKRRRKGEYPDRERMLLWMERMKNGVDVIKTTFGPEWMYIWLLNEYGRALNARMHLEAIFQRHVAQMASRVPNIRHLEGHTQHDVTTQPIPILAVRENRLRQAEGILGDAHIHPQFPASPRQRSHSAPDVCNYNTDSSEDDAAGDMTEFSTGEEDLNFRAAELHRQQAAEYASALRELDLVAPPQHPSNTADTEMRTTNTVSEQAPRQRAETHTGVASSRTDIHGSRKAHESLRNQLVKLEKESTRVVQSSGSFASGDASISTGNLSSHLQPSLKEMMDQQQAAASVSSRPALYQPRVDEEETGLGGFAVQGHPDDISELHSVASMPMTTSRSPSYDSGLLTALSDDPSVASGPHRGSFSSQPPASSRLQENLLPTLNDDPSAASRQLSQHLDHLKTATMSSSSSIPMASDAPSAASRQLSQDHDHLRATMSSTSSLPLASPSIASKPSQDHDNLRATMSSSNSIPMASPSAASQLSKDHDHLRATMSSSNSIPMTATGVQSARSRAESDLISTTSTIQMLEDMEQNRIQQSEYLSASQPDLSAATSGDNKGVYGPSITPTHNTAPPTTPPRAQPPTFDSNPQQQQTNGSPIPLLERIMRQHDLGGNGISQVVATELSLLIWMMMDTGNAWTCMALSLLSTDKEACTLVQEELDVLELEFGRGNDLYSPQVLNRMKYLDAVLYEAIRLCPANFGGMKKTTETIEMKESGVQIAKGTNVFFCQPTDLKFDIRGALGKKPEHLGRRYPSVELHGFLPLHGLEVPLMVLQSKVFLISLLQRFTPSLSLRKNFIRRVGAKVRHSLYSLKNMGANDPATDFDVSMDLSAHSGNVLGPIAHEPSSPFSGLEACKHEDVSQKEAMAMFTKTPFPEPRRVIHLQPRSLD